MRSSIGGDWGRAGGKSTRNFEIGGEFAWSRQVLNHDKASGKVDEAETSDIMAISDKFALITIKYKYDFIFLS